MNHVPTPDDAAERSRASLITAHPDGGADDRGRAQLAERRHAHHDAIRHWTAVLQRVPRDLEALGGLARVYEQVGDMRASLANYGRMIAVHPEEPAGYVGAARLTQATQGAESAVRGWRDASARFPAEILPHLELVDCLIEVGRLDEAERHVDAVCASFPDDHRALVSRARLALARHHYTVARALWEDIRNRFGTTVQALLDYAHHIRQYGGTSFDVVISTLERVLGIDPDNLTARCLLARCFLELGRAEDARVILSGIRHGQPAQAHAAVVFAQAEHAAGQTAVAEGMLAGLAGSSEASVKLYALSMLADLQLRDIDMDGLRQTLAELDRIADREPAVRAWHLRLRDFACVYQGDPKALEEMRRVVAAERERLPHATVRSLLELSTRHPDYVPLMLQIAQRLHTHGFIAPFAAVKGGPQGPEPGIPRRIVQFWDSPDIPDDIRMAMETWRREYSDWQYRVFDDAAAVEFIDEHYSTKVVDAYRACEHPAMKSDFFRHTYLFVRGGIYVDADEACCQELEIPPSLTLVLRFENRSPIAEFLPGFYASAPRHPMLAELIDDMVYRVTNRLDDDHWFSVGPGLFTKHVVRQLARSGILEQPPTHDDVLVLLQTQYQQYASAPDFSYKKTERNWLQARYAGR